MTTRLALINAQSHAARCWEALEEHARGVRRRVFDCECSVDPEVILAHPMCETAEALVDEYNIAVARVSELGGG